jgi:Tol biopolymer transport system component
MAENEWFDEAVSRWLEEAAPARLPERVLNATFERTRGRRQRVGWRALVGRLSMPRFMPALGGAVVLVLVAAVALTLYLNWQGGPGVSPSPTPSTGPDLGIFEPVAGWIVYGTDTGIWAVDPRAPAGATTSVQLTSEAAMPLGWSSDGTRLLIKRLIPQASLFVLHADGSETQVTDRTAIRGGAISPDGTRVVFAVYTTPATDSGVLYAVDVDGGPAEVLSARVGTVREMTFSPDGTRIAWVEGAGDHSHSVWMIGADGTNAHQVLANETTLGPGHQYGLAWSPAGDRIAIGLGAGTYTFAPDGSAFTLVITGGGEPQWSPDGTQLAYTWTDSRIDAEGVPISAGLLIANADGSDVRWHDLNARPGPWHPGTHRDAAGESD